MPSHSGRPGPERFTPSPAPGARVLVVGGGPTGLTAANLLGAMGIAVLLVERNAATSDEAKAISLDDESLRGLQLAGLDASIYPIILPGTGTRYFGARGQTLVHARGTKDRLFGHPFKNPFAQPDLERVLRAGLGRFPQVTTRFATALIGLEQRPGSVRATLRPTGHDGTPDVQDVAYVLACDGGRSTVREALGIGMTGRSFDDVWLVVDALDDPHDQRYGMHHGDPRRPHVIVPGRNGRCRYEFRLQPGEAEPGTPPPFELIRDLVRPYRALAPEQVERAVAYRFNAVLADRMRDGRCFLLGDAAHMMPPFAGQGLNSGIRDAVNLCWKIAEVLNGQAGDPLLDTYEAERRPHAQAVTALSVRLGRVVMTTDRRYALLRDAVVGVAMRTRRGRRHLAEMRYRPTTRLETGVVVPAGDRRAHELVGCALPQPDVLVGADHRRTRLDDVLGAGWSLLAVHVPDDDWATVGSAHLPAATCVDVVLDDRAATQRHGRSAVAPADDRLDALLGAVRGRFLLVRPDRVVAAVFPARDVGRVAAALGRAGVRCLPASEAPHRSTAVAPDTTAEPYATAGFTRAPASTSTGGTRS